MADLQDLIDSGQIGESAVQRVLQRNQALRDVLIPEWSKPFAGMTPEQANREAQTLASGKQAPGKIGPGYLSDTQRLGDAAADVASLAAPEAKVAMAAAVPPGLFQAARKAVPIGKVAESAEAIALHPDSKRRLIASLYGDAEAEREVSQRAAQAEGVHQMELEHGFYMVNDPAERARSGLPPIPENARRLSSGRRAVPGGPLDPASVSARAASVRTAPVSPAPETNAPTWLDILKARQ